MTKDCVRSFVSKIFRHIVARTVVALPQFLSSSEEMLLTPRHFLVFRLSTASSTSSLSMVRLSACLVGVWLVFACVWMEFVVA